MELRRQQLQAPSSAPWCSWIVLMDADQNKIIIKALAL